MNKTLILFLTWNFGNWTLFTKSNRITSLLLLNLIQFITPERKNGWAHDNIFAGKLPHIQGFLPTITLVLGNYLWVVLTIMVWSILVCVLPLSNGATSHIRAHDPIFIVLPKIGFPFFTPGILEAYRGGLCECCNPRKGRVRSPPFLLEFVHDLHTSIGHNDQGCI